MVPPTLILSSSEAALPKEPLATVTHAGIPNTSDATPEEHIQTIDGLLRHRARTCPDSIIVSYPSEGIKYVDYTARQLDVFAYRVARQYQSVLPSRSSSAEQPLVVGLLGPSNFEYTITMLGLIKLGHTILFLSTRISEEAIDSLMQTTGAKFLIADPRYLQTADKVKERSGIQVLPIASKSSFEFEVDGLGDTRLDSALDPSVETANTVYIIHSSGSTGLPKPIFQRQNAAIANYAINMEMKAFITLPLFHNHGICNFFRAIYAVKSIHLYNADLPLTSDYLTRIFQEHEFEIFYGVPYALKLLAETDVGIELLRSLKVVMYGGSACPDELGDLLVSRGVNLVSHYGATEVGQLMTSFRGPGDRYWNYVRETDKLAPYLRWIPRGPNLFECAVTEGWQSKVATNQPDGSYNTKDLFEPHPTIPGAWKYIARLDDTIVLVNGEKFNPVQMEGAVRSNPLVAETVVFGAGRPSLGLLVVPSPSTEGLSNDEIVDALWPTVEVANRSVEAYAKVSKGMITLLPQECQYPRTDKGSIIRQAFYKNFAKEIDATYDRADSASDDVRVMEVEELKTFLRAALSRVLGSDIPADDTADFFSFGVDSLQAIQMRSEILKNVDVAGHKLGHNVVFDYPSVQRLTTYLAALRDGGEGQQVSVETEMQNLIDRHSRTLAWGPQRKMRTSVAVTGATGSLGAHVVAQLASDPTISRIYCLDLRAVIHCAWAVNFNMALSSFEECITGVTRLVQLCRFAPDATATLAFCSSVSTVARYIPPASDPSAPVPERLPELSWAQGMGYAQSKNVAEHLVLQAGMWGAVPTRVLRIGQIVGDTQHGVWNVTEAIPLMMQTAQTVGALPTLPEEMAWLPVDTVARAVVDITFADADGDTAVVANVVNPQTFNWTRDLLPALRAAGLRFDEVAPKEWIRRLRDSDQDPTRNPPIKLVDFFASKYDREDEGFGTTKSYATSVSTHLSAALGHAPTLDQDLVNKFVQYFVRDGWAAGP
ncbi:acetyl-CoA synthetase-like protein [Thozetella sp. PMI_491]|nr:acetyl-CoA synthetase-like protein [Thozetella sp. PMI_491]